MKPIRGDSSLRWYSTSAISGRGRCDGAAWDALLAHERDVAEQAARPPEKVMIPCPALGWSGAEWRTPRPFLQRFVQSTDGKGRVGAEDGGLPRVWQRSMTSSRSTALWTAWPQLG